MATAWTTDTRTAIPRLALISAPTASWPVSKIRDPAEPEIDRHEHQSGAMRDCHGEGPEAQLRRSYPRQHLRMAPVDNRNAEADDQETGADLDLLLPLDEGDQQRERKDHHENCQQMAGR